MNAKFSVSNSLRSAFLAALAAFIVAACGGGTGGTGTTNSPVVSTGVMQKGSVIVNGVRFEDNTAQITIDDTPKTSAALQNGMVVKVQGSVSSDGVNGTAQRVKALIEVRGFPTTVSPLANPPSLILLNQVVIADDQTVLSNLPNFAAITTLTLIEVHGLRDATGQIRATRIEANQLQMGDATTDEIRGFVSNGTGTNPTTFDLGSQAVDATGAVIVPTGATYQNGSVVEVFCSTRPCILGGAFQASRVKVEDAQDSAFQPSPGQRREVEGLISGFTGHPGNFFVAGTPVTTTSSTRFEGGISTDLADNVKVEAEGTWNGSALVANKIEFKRSVVRLQGLVTISAAPSFTLNIIGAGAVTVQADGFTTGDFAGGAVPPVSTTDCIQVRGQRKAGGGVVVTAGEIRSGCSSSQDHLIQAPVEAENGTTLTLLGFAIDVGSPTDNQPFQNIDDSAMTSAQFFNAVVPANPGPPSVAGTLVKIRFNTPAVTVKQVELED